MKLRNSCCAAWLSGCLAALALTAALAVSPAEVLKPEEAFRYSLTAEPDALIVNWRIEPEYYLYKKRMSFSSATPGVELGEPQMPAGLPYTDEFFGDMEIYRGNVQVRIPIIARPEKQTTLSLEIVSQGCADIGLCYPPQNWTASTDLPAAPAANSRLSRMLGPDRPANGPDDPLPPQEAFQAVVMVEDPFTLSIEWNIAAGYYLYRDSLAVSGSSDTVAVSRPVIPAGVWQNDEYFGDTQVFYNSMTMTVPLNRASPQPDSLTLNIDYQGCKQDSICYPPENYQRTIDIPLATAADKPRPLISEPPMISEQDRLSALIVNGNLFLVLATFTGLGLLLAFTPCVLPMVPILSGIIAGQGKTVTTGRAFTLSLIFVLGMAITYTAAGAAFAAAGGQLQAVLQKPAVLIGVSILFGLMAVAMFGWYELQMPAAIQTRLTAISNRQRAGTFFGTAIMGMLSALVVTTCVAPPLVAAIAVIAKTGDLLRGALSLFFMSLGMGIPLLVIGTSAGKLLPKAGPWMTTVRNIFGLMLLGLAIWMLERMLPAFTTMLLWAALALTAGLMFAGLPPFKSPTASNAVTSKIAGYLCLAYCAALLASAFTGHINPLRPLAFISSSEHRSLEFQRIKSVDDFQQALREAQDNQQTVMLDFYADWCVSCKEMEFYTFVDDDVQQLLSDTVLLQADVTANDALDKALLNYFGIFGPPTIVFFDGQGQERTGYRVVGFMSSDEFAAHVAGALNAGLPSP